MRSSSWNPVMTDRDWSIYNIVTVLVLFQAQHDLAWPSSLTHLSCWSSFWLTHSGPQWASTSFFTSKWDAWSVITLRSKEKWSIRERFPHHYRPSNSGRSARKAMSPACGHKSWSHNIFEGWRLCLVSGHIMPLVHTARMLLLPTTQKHQPWGPSVNLRENKAWLL